MRHGAIHTPQTLDNTTRVGTITQSWIVTRPAIRRTQVSANHFQPVEHNTVVHCLRLQCLPVQARIAHHTFCRPQQPLSCKFEWLQFELTTLTLDRTSTFTGSTIVSTNTVLTTKTVPGPTVTAVTTYNLLKRDDPAFTMVTTHGIHLFPVNQRLKARDSTVRQLPTYASVCAALQYISACSCLGVTASTTTLSGLTTYVTVIPSTTTIVTSTTTATAQGSTFVTATT